jgi:PAS domain S-box-containing protein
MKAALPANEEARLQALYRLDVLDTPREQNFDDIAQLAMSICAVPIAVVSLVDRDRQWFKSCLGLDATETPRDLAFCAHAILSPGELLVAEDARLDPRFADNPLVTGEPHIRFYAGAPLVAKCGAALGTLCVVDYHPRQLTAVQKNTLRLLANQVMQLLQLRETNLALQQSEERLHTMISNFPGAVYRCCNDARWTMLYLSEAVARLTGHTAAEFIGDHSLSFTDITHADDVPTVYENVQAALARQTPFDLVYRMQHASGHWLYVQEVGAGVYDQQGDLKYIDGFIWDITQTKQAHDAIESNEQKLSTLYNQAPIAITLNNYSDGKFIECNPEFCRLLGYTHRDILQLGYQDITPPGYAQEDFQQLESLHISGRYGPYEKHFIHRDGRLIPVLLNGVLIETPGGERQIWSFIQDITERKRIEQMKNEFVSAVSHELRTPLTSISGSLGMVVGGMLGELPAKVKDMLAIAHKNAMRLTLLINDLLDMEKLLAGKMDFDLRPQRLLPIVQQSLEGNTAYADTFGVRLQLQAGVDDVQIVIDTQRLQQVLANFISNAVKFSPSQGQVEIVVSQQGEQVKVAVVDHGPGVSDEFRARIFQKFSQADSSDSRQRGGTGLGLAISKAFVERMQGTIGYDSELGKGATFYALFPLYRPQANTSID